MRNKQFSPDSSGGGDGLSESEDPGSADQNEARLENEFLRTVVQTADCLVVVLDPKGSIVLFNAACERLTGYQQREMIGRSVFERLLPSNEIAPARRVFNQLLHGFFPVHHENEWVTLEGERRRIAWSNTVLLDGDEKVEYIISTGIDITQRRRALEQLRERERRLEAVFENTAEVIIVINERGIIEAANPAVERMFGYSPSELWGVNVSKLMPQPHRAEHDGYIRRFIQTGEARIIGSGRKVPALRKDGTVFPAHLTASEMIEDGERRFVGVLFDLSERDRLQGEILTAVEQEQSRIARELHDNVGSSLAGIHMMIARLTRQLEAAGIPEAAYAQEVEQLIRRVHQDVRHIMRPLVPLDLEEFCVRSAIIGLADVVSAGGDIQCRCECGGEIQLPPDHGLHLYRIAQEAVQNAAKHAAARRLLIALRHQAQGIVLTVRDDGNGFDGLPKPNGLGLRSMHYRASIIGGDIHIRSAPGKGTTILCFIWHPSGGRSPEFADAYAGDFDEVWANMGPIEDAPKSN